MCLCGCAQERHNGHLPFYLDCSSTAALAANKFHSALVLLTFPCLSSGQKCAFHTYYTQGLMSLNSTITENVDTKGLILYLGLMVQNCKVSDHRYLVLYATLQLRS